MAKPTAAWVRMVEQRQLPRRFGPAYRAAQQTTSREAPPGSRPKRIFSVALQRYLQTLSRPEKDAVPILLHHPRIFELWDQWMLNPRPEIHPAQNHPHARFLRLPSTTGTLMIADGMGLMRKHPAVRDPETREFLPVPLLGDLLLFLMDDQGPYCVHFDVKRNEGDHGLPLVDEEIHASKREIANARFKHELRLQYLKELAIPSVPLHLAVFDPALVRNLQRLCSVHSTSSPLSAELQTEIIEAFRESLPAAQPPLTVIARFVARGVPSHQVTELLDQAIWYRKLRVDLFQEVRTDLPLCPEVIDPFEKYAHLFTRTASLTPAMSRDNASPP
jgi:hypothetical protein